jgi:hypothetical protein
VPERDMQKTKIKIMTFITPETSRSKIMKVIYYLYNNSSVLKEQYPRSC